MFISVDVIAYFTAHFYAVGREIQIYTRAKFDESQMLVQVTFFSSVSIGDDATGERAGNLSDKHLFSVYRSFYDNAASFVFLTRLRQECSLITPILMLIMSDFSFEWIPVGVNICHRHEDRHLQAFPVQNFVFENRLYHHDFTICRRHDVVWILDGYDAFGVAEKVGEKNQMATIPQPSAGLHIMILRNP